MDFADSQYFRSGNSQYRSLDAYWHPVAYGSEVRESPVQVTLLDRQLVLGRINERLVALDDRCAHRGAALSSGKIVDDCFECPFHGWRFDSQGNCAHAPGSNASKSVLSKSRILNYPVVESAGLIWVCLEQVPQYALPKFPEYSEAGYRTRPGIAFEWETSVSRCVENLIDISTFSSDNDSRGETVKDELRWVETWWEKSTLCFESPLLENGRIFRMLEAVGVAGASRSALTDTYRVGIPGTVHRRRMIGDGEKCYVLFFAASPITTTRTRCFWSYSRNFSESEEYDSLFLEGVLNDLASRRSIVESQFPKIVPICGGERQRESLVCSYDTPIHHYRNALLESSRLHLRSREDWSDCS